MRHLKRLLHAAGAASALALALGSTTAGCLNRPIERVDPRTTSTVVERLQQNGVDKIDLLLDIDNSISMADKQQILAAAVPDLVNRLVTPNCVDDKGVATGEIVDAMGKCPDGSKPEFPPIRNINIGVISSSLGDLTSGACGNASILNPDDKGHLLTRTKSGAPAPADYKSQGFLGWDPDNTRGGQTDPGALISDLGNMVVGVDQVGCGYEMQLEAALRFLADPDPYDSLEVGDGQRLKEVGTDMVLLQQRKDFLRPDSLLAVLILSDENDCSLAVNGQGFLALKGPFYRSTSECKTDPNDPCCTSCGLNPPAECDKGGDCSGPGGAKYKDLTEDSQNLKCYRQKERYGVDFLYPTSRYVNAFSQYKIDSSKTDFAGDAEDNPIFQDLQGSGASVRTTDLVFVAGIVGVPWQAIARKNDGGDPDLSLGFKTFDELQGDLDYLIGDPDNHVDPGEPFMVESTEKRQGTSTLTGASLPGANAINGNDWTIYDAAANEGPDDLEYACVFDLATPVDGGNDCADCTDASCDNPLCNNTQQIKAKAYPGLRELAVLRGMASQGIFASICPAEPVDTSSPIYGYRPAVNTIVDRLKEQLGGQCLPRKLTVDPETGGVDCLVIEATQAAGDCKCGAGREAIAETNSDGSPNAAYNAVKAAQTSDFANPNWNCFCEIEQLTKDPDKKECQNTDDPKASTQGDGWCYIDAAPDNQIGNPDLVAGCPEDEKRLVRFVGEGEPKTGATVFVTCTGD